MRHLGIIVVAALGWGCGGSSSPDHAPRREPTGPTAEVVAAEEPAPPPEAPMDTFYALADRVGEAERFELGGATPVLLADLGVPGSAKYTVGGFQTSALGDRDIDGVSATVFDGTRAKIVLPIERGGPTQVIVRARGVGGEVTLEGATVSRSFGLLELSLPDARPGTTTITLRAPRAGTLEDGTAASVAVDWVRVASAGVEASREAPRPLVANAGSGHALVLPALQSVRYTVPIPAQARFRARVAADRALGCHITPIGEEPIACDAVRGRIDVDLASIAGKLATIELETREGPDLAIAEAAVMVPPREARDLGTRPKNVILYLVDTLRADKLQPYNPRSRVRTPNLSSFVDRAAAMTRAHTQENWTKPSVATLLSSLMPWQHTAVTGEAVVPESVRLLPELLSSRGFYTGSFIANGYVSDRFGFRQGWDTYRNYIREEVRTQSEFVAADVLRWLDARPADKPFFLYVHMIDPHVPYRPPEEFSNMYDPTEYNGVVNFRRDATLLENIKLGRLTLNARDKDHLAALYDGEITYHDVHFGAILEGLSRRGIDDETMIVITADHGEEFWDHGSVGHGHSVYEELLHIPMFVRLPGVTETAARIDEPVGLVDVMPTILDALGQEIPEELAGRSMLDLVRGTDTGPRVAVSGFMDNWRAISLDHYKLIVKPDGSAMLFDLATDAGEENDIADEQPQIASLLRQRLGLELARTPSGARAPRGRPAHRAVETEIDPETARQLRALGYVGN